MDPKTQPTKLPPKQTNSNRTVIIIVIIAAVLILAVGGYFGWKYVSKNYLKSKADTTTTPTAAFSPSSTPTLSITTMPTVIVGTSPNTSTDTTKKIIASNYVITDSNTRLISEAELINLTPWELKVARNEIYARHGRPFVHKDLQCYFAGKSWYHGNPNYSESLLTVVENKNVNTIQTYEQKINSPLANRDSGC